MGGPLISLSLPPDPGVTLSVEYFAPLPVTPRGDTYTLLFVDRSTRLVDMYAVSAAEFAAEGTASILVKKCTWSASLLSDNGLHLCSKLSLAVYKMQGMFKLATSARHLNGSNVVLRVRESRLDSNAHNGHQSKTGRLGCALATRGIFLPKIMLAPPQGEPPTRYT